MSEPRRFPHESWLAAYAPAFRATTIVGVTSLAVVAATVRVELEAAAIERPSRVAAAGMAPSAPEASGAAGVLARAREIVRDRAPASARIEGELVVPSDAASGRIAVYALPIDAPLLARVAEPHGVAASELLAASERADVDRDGRFSMAAPTGAVHALVVLGERIAPAASTATPGARARVVLAAGKAIAGRVVESSGEGIPGARIAAVHAREAVPESAGPIECRYAWAAFRAETGSLADGSFELGGLGDGPYTLLVTAPSRGTAKLVGIRPGVDPLVIALHPAGSISGTVTDGAGHPIPGISIALARRTSSADLEESGDGRSGLDGRFAFTDVASGGSALVLQASGEGFATRRLTLPPLTTGGAREVEVVLEPSSELAIRVVGSRGEPLAGAAVEAHGIADSAFVGSATTGAGGIATIPGASATRLYRVYAEAPGHVVGIAPGASTESIVELRLDPAYALAGRVVDAGGAGAAARVRLIRSSDRDVTLEQLDATADASGGFRFDGLAAGDVRLVAEAPGFAPAQVGPLHVGPGADGAFAGDVVIALDAGVAWIGRVRTEDGDAIADAVVSLVTKAPASARASDVLGVATRTARDGAFRLEHVPSRATALLVSAPDLAPRLLRIPDASASPAGVRDLGDLRLARGGGVVGRVVDAAGRPLAGIRIGLSSRESFGAAAPRTETGADGEFAIRGVAPGAYSLDAVDPAGTGLESGFERITVGVDVESGADSVVIVDGREHGRVTGRVRIGGAPPRFETEVALAIPDGSGRELAASHVGWDGSFSLPAPIAGTLAIEVRSLEGTAIRASRLVTLRERESRHVAIDVGGAAVEGRVRAKSDGAPLAGARVELVTAQGGRCCVAADGEGRFAIEGLPDGVASLTVEAPGHARARVRGIALSERARATCDVALEAEAAIVVRAVGPDGEPLAGAHVSILNRDGDLVAEGVADRSGEVAANALRAAEYGVVVEHESCLPRSIHLALTAGRVTRQDVELEKP